MRNPRDFLKPLANRRPEPVREIPCFSVAMIHFLSSTARTRDCRESPYNRADLRHPARNLDGRGAVSIARRLPAPPPVAGLVKRSGRTSSSCDTQLWTRVTLLESPWVLENDITYDRHRVGHSSM